MGQSDGLHAALAVQLHSTMCAGAYTALAVRTMIKAIVEKNAPWMGHRRHEPQSGTRHDKPGAMQARWKCR